MINRVAAESLIFRSACTFVADQVGIGAADTRRTRCLMRINHQFIISSLRQAIEVVIIYPLIVVVIATRQHVAHIAAFYGRITIVYHKLISFIEMALVVARRRRRFVVHNHLNAF